MITYFKFVLYLILLGTSGVNYEDKEENCNHKRFSSGSKV